MAQDQENCDSDIGPGWVMLPQSLVDMMRDERTDWSWAGPCAERKAREAAQSGAAADDLPAT